MNKKEVLLITADQKTEASIREALDGYEVSAAPGSEAAAAAIKSPAAPLVIIDFDVKDLNGLEEIRRVQELNPKSKIIAISIANNIPLAVAATKLGIFDFLKKPLTAKQLRGVVEGAFGLEKARPFLPARAAWLTGGSQKLQKMYDTIQAALADDRRNLALLGEAGIDKLPVVEFIQARGARSKRKLNTIDLAYFRKESDESYFWSSIQEMLAEPAADKLLSEEDRCGVLYLENFEKLDETFKASIAEFMSKRPGKTDKQVLVVVDILTSGRNHGLLDQNFTLVEIPPVRERKDDLAGLLNYYLGCLARKHNKNVRGFSAAALDRLAAYDYPGNYQELEDLIEQGVLTATTELIELPDLAIGFREIAANTIERALQRGELGLEEAQRAFEQELYTNIVARTSGDLGAAANFLDLPRGGLSGRLEELGDYLAE